MQSTLSSFHAGHRTVHGEHTLLCRLDSRRCTFALTIGSNLHHYFRTKSLPQARLLGFICNVRCGKALFPIDTVKLSYLHLRRFVSKVYAGQCDGHSIACIRMEVYHMFYRIYAWQYLCPIGTEWWHLPSFHSCQVVACLRELLSECFLWRCNQSKSNPKPQFSCNCIPQ